MNQSAERHLAKAEEYIGKGEEFYRKAATEIVAAKDADPSLTNVVIGERLGHSDHWVGKLLKWLSDPIPGSTPFGGRTAEQKGRGAVEARRILRDAPMEQVEQIIAELPASRQRQIGAAAGHEYLSRVNEVADNTRRNVTEGVGRMFWPNIHSESALLLRKLKEIGEWLDRHGDDMIPEPSGEAPTEPARDIMLDGLRVDKAKIDAAFAELGVGTSIEEGFDRLLSES